jgi:hypothetical protein
VKQNTAEEGNEKERLKYKQNVIKEGTAETVFKDVRFHRPDDGGSTHL